MNKTNINWCDYTWNPITGCTKIAQGCKFCYAETIAKRFWNGRDFSDVRFHEDRLNDKVLKSKTPKRIFVNSMSDPFHEKISYEQINSILKIIQSHPQHTFLVLTKRIERATNFNYGDILNLHLCYSVSIQKDLENVKYLLMTNAKVKGLSIEPQLEDIFDIPKLDWLIVGCESGLKRRPFYNSWAKGIINRNPNTPIWIKQIRDEKNNVIDDINLFPPELQIRQLP